VVVVDLQIHQELQELLDVLLVDLVVEEGAMEDIQDLFMQEDQETVTDLLAVLQI
jgi:hypothetical protein